MKSLFVVLAGIVFFLIMPAALARGSGSHTGSHRSKSGNAIGFAKGRCKTAKCSAKHPDGSYTHPITPKKGK